MRIVLFLRDLKQRRTAFIVLALLSDVGVRFFRTYLFKVFEDHYMGSDVSFDILYILGTGEGGPEAMDAEERRLPFSLGVLMLVLMT